MKEIYKFTNNLSPIINHMFQFRENSDNLRYLQQLASSTKKTTKIDYRGPQLSNLVPQEIKESVYFLMFKEKINGIVQTVHADFVVLFSPILVLYEKYFYSWLSYIYIHKHRCRGIDGTRPTPGMGLFCEDS